MKLHANAPLGPRGRERMVLRVLEQGWSITEAASAAGVSDRTCSKWIKSGALHPHPHQRLGLRRDYASSQERTAALDGWLWTYNHRRPHGSLSHKPPAARLNELNNLPSSYS
jgi:transposase InsO family protein